MWFDKLFDLSNRVAVVSGAGRGIGKAIAVGLAEYGAEIAVVDILPLEELRSVKKEVEDVGRKCLIINADVSKEERVKRAVDTIISEYGKIDILVNNAGIIKRGPAEEATLDDWNETLSVNLLGYFLCCKYVFPYMKNRLYGKIINIASTDAEYPGPNKISYVSSKGAVVTLTKALAVEWAKYHINVNAVSPYMVPGTGFSKTWLGSQKEYLQLASKNPMAKILTPEDIVGSVIFLASKASDAITGCILYVDYGYRISPIF